MTGRRTTSSFLPLWLAVLCVGLGWIAFERLQSPAPSDLQAALSPAGSTAEIDVEIPGDFVLPPIETYAAITERPLFTRSRRPPSEEAPIPVAATLDLELTGVIISGEERIALLRDTETGVLMRLSVGDQVQGWFLTGIETEQVELQSDGRSVTIVLDYDREREPPPRRERENGSE
jgi:general secretion pathway protein N